jgi:DNA polymerase-3 subunit gamma/tau
MSYQVFARVWRPKVFEDVVGQEHVTTTLKKAIEKQRVAHAYIFTGTRGVGKTTTARILARCLNCDTGPTPEPCGTCASCKSIESGSSLDVIEIDGASNNSVENIRDLRETISYTSMGGKYRIFVIDEVHMLSKSAFNALLKTLEEPPPNVIFIFATTEPQKIPTTIHSRCQRYDFRRISSELIQRQLIKICEKNDIKYERPGIALIARKADGSMRDGLSLLDQVCSFCKDSLTEKEIRSVLGLVENEVYASLMNAIAEGHTHHLLQAVNDVLVEGFDLHEFIAGFEVFLRNVLFMQVPQLSSEVSSEIFFENIEEYRELTRQFPETKLLRMIEIIRSAERDLKWSSYPRFLVESMLIKLMYIDATVSFDQLVKCIEQTQSSDKGNGEPSSAASVQKSAVKKKVVSTPDAPIPALHPVSQVKEPRQGNDHAEEAVISSPPDDKKDVESFSYEENGEVPADFKNIWPSFIAHLVEMRPNLGSFLSLAYIESTTAHSIDLRFPQEFRFQFNEIIKRQNRNEILRIFKEFTGTSADVHITIETKKNSAKNANYVHVVGDVPRSIEDEIEAEPVIKTLLEAFDGEILP